MDSVLLSTEEKQTFLYTYNHHNTSHYATTSDTHCEPIITLHIEELTHYNP